MGISNGDFKWGLILKGGSEWGLIVGILKGILNGDFEREF